MYHDFNSVAEYRMALYKAIDDTMQDDVTYKAQTAIMQSIEENVYGAYHPKYTGRPGTIKSPRRVHGGLKDRANLVATYVSADRTLTIKDEAPWQNVGFQEINGVGTYQELSEAVEQSDIYGAPPRPFAEWAELDYKHSGKFEKDLQHGIIRRGL